MGSGDEKKRSLETIGAPEPAEPQGSDRRQHPRVEVKAPAMVVFEGKDLGPVQIQDISKGGLFVKHGAPEIPFRTGARITLKMVNDKEAFTLAGEVVRVLDPNAPGKIAGYGVQLINAPHDVVERVTNLAVSVKAKPRTPSGNLIPIPAASEPAPEAPEGSEPGGPAKQ